MKKASKLTVYWTENHQTALEAVYRLMRERHIPCEFNGKPNVSAIIQYALELAAAESPSASPSGNTTSTGPQS